jgi:uncharacterized protein YndB with AHSA1/START domain
MTSPTTPTGVNRISDHEVVVTRTFDAPAHLAFEAWTDSTLFARWWVPKSFPIKLVSCEVDARVGGRYKLGFAVEGKPEPMEFFGTYLEVVPASRLVWTNEEGEDGGAVTTVTFEEKDGKTLLTLTDRYPSKEALDEAMESGSTSCSPETFEQLAELLATQGKGAAT